MKPGQLTLLLFVFVSLFLFAFTGDVCRCRLTPRVFCSLQRMMLARNELVPRIFHLCSHQDKSAARCLEPCQISFGVLDKKCPLFPSSSLVVERCTIPLCHYIAFVKTGRAESAPWQFGCNEIGRLPTLQWSWSSQNH